MVQDLWHVGEQLGVRAGETLCHITYLEMSRSLVSMPISQTHTPTDAQKQTHATNSTMIIVVFILLENVKTQASYKDDFNNL